MVATLCGWEACNLVKSGLDGCELSLQHQLEELHLGYGVQEVEVEEAYSYNDDRQVVWNHVDVRTEVAGTADGEDADNEDGYGCVVMEE